MLLRRSPEAHKRLMLLASIAFLQPASARLFIWSPLGELGMIALRRSPVRQPEIDALGELGQVELCPRAERLVEAARQRIVVVGCVGFVRGAHRVPHLVRGTGVEVGAEVGSRQ